MEINQPIEVVVAATKSLAEKALNIARTAYTDFTQPILDVNTTTKINTYITQLQPNEANKKETDVMKVVKNINIYGKFYYTMENIVCVSKNVDESLKEQPPSRFMDGIQVMVSKFLDVDCNSVDVCTRRLGGGYGVRMIQMALAYGLATHKQNRPYRLIHPLWTITRVVGKNFPCSADFEMAVNSFGMTQLNYNIHHDIGYTNNKTILCKCKCIHLTIYGIHLDRTINVIIQSQGEQIFRLEHLSCTRLIYLSHTCLH